MLDFDYEVRLCSLVDGEYAALPKPSLLTY